MYSPSIEEIEESLELAEYLETLEAQDEDELLEDMDYQREHSLYNLIQKGNYNASSNVYRF